MEWSLTEYNLLVYGDSNIPIFKSPSGSSRFVADRLFEYTNKKFAEKYQDNIAKLELLPTLVVAELNHADYTPAFMGRISNVVRDGTGIQFDYQHMYSHLSSEDVFGCGHFDIDVSGQGIDERFRMHWAIKEGNVIEGILKLTREQSSMAKPRLFQTERWPLPILRRNAAVMMPFKEEFLPVYRAIQSACTDQQFHAVRVDEIYRPTPIINDVFIEIAQSRFVISDLTGRNPNVLYETGLAHALNREVIIIAQDRNDIPFDLQHLRNIKYQPNDKGLVTLQKDLGKFLQAGNSS